MVQYEGLKSVTLRVEDAVVEAWDAYVAQKLGNKRQHFVCAMLLYIMGPETAQDAVQAAYLRFKQTGKLPSSLSVSPDLTPDEAELIALYRGMDPDEQVAAVESMRLRQLSEVEPNHNAGKPKRRGRSAG
jgi:hypothetical protein